MGFVCFIGVLLGFFVIGMGYFEFVLLWRVFLFGFSSVVFFLFVSFRRKCKLEISGIS